jgi:steroid 5-alpha reductase family enzyme
MAIVGKAEHKAVVMSKNIISTVYYICLAAALCLIIYRWYLRSVNRNDAAGVIQWVAVALLMVALICRFLPKVFSRFRQGPTNESNERQIHKE